MKFTKIASGWIETEDKPTYHGWPTVCRLKSGRLLAAASGGRIGHVCPFGRSYCYASDDGGLTWSKPQILSSGPLDDRDCGLAEAADGSVLLNYITAIGYRNTARGCAAPSTAAARGVRNTAFRSSTTTDRR